jgi:hypothetical protein
MRSRPSSEKEGGPAGWLNWLACLVVALESWLCGGLGFGFCFGGFAYLFGVLAGFAPTAHGNLAAFGSFIASSHWFLLLSYKD